MTNLLMQALRLANDIKASDLSQTSLINAKYLCDQIYQEIIKNLLDKDQSGLTKDEKALLLANERIKAIKAVRERTGLGLKEAKALTDRWQNENMGTNY